MKKILLSILIISLPTMSQARVDYDKQSAMRVTSNLIQTLTQMSNLSLDFADRATLDQDHRLARQFDGISDDAHDLSRSIHRYVMREIKLGASARKLERNMRDFDRDFGNLKRSLQALPVCPPALERFLNQIESLCGQYFELLSGGNTPLSASCTAKTGGNFFVPKTHMECTVYGRGAVGYEVILAGRVTLHGTLNANQATQKFVSEKAKVGYDPSYQVYLVTRRGDRKLVAERR